MKKIYNIFIIACMLPAACNESRQMTTTLPPDRAAAGYNATITDTYWNLVELNGKAVIQTPDDKPIYVRFNSKENQVEGNGGCNQMLGRFELSVNERIKINAGFTKMACAAGKMEIENNFGNALAMTDSYSVKGDTMHLFKARMAPLAKFEAKYFPR